MYQCISSGYTDFAPPRETLGERCAQEPAEKEAIDIEAEQRLWVGMHYKLVIMLDSAGRGVNKLKRTPHSLVTTGQPG